MKSNRLWAVGTAIAIVAVLALGWVLGISPKLAELASVTASLSGVQAQNQQHQADLTRLQQQFEAIDELRAELDELKAAIPDDVDLPDFIRQLNTLAAESGVAIDSITTASPAAYSVPSTPGTTVDEEGNEVPLPAAPANLVTVSMTIKVTGAPKAILLFAQGLENGERLFFVGDLVLSEPKKAKDEEGGAVTSTGEISGLTFILTSAPAPAS